MIMTSYHGRWNGQKKMKARLRASAGVTAGRPGTASGSRKNASSATMTKQMSAIVGRCVGVQVAPNGPAAPNGR
jgi:hypothetical protein